MEEKQFEALANLLGELVAQTKKYTESNAAHKRAISVCKKLGLTPEQTVTVVTEFFFYCEDATREALRMKPKQS